MTPSPGRQHGATARAVRRAAVLLALAAGLWARPAAAGDPLQLDYPRLGNIFLPAFVDSTVIQSLAQWDLVILNSIWTNAQLAQLRALNPDIRIFFYTIVYVVDRPPGTGDPWRNENYAYAAANDMWWYDTDGNPASDWPNTYMANVTDYCPVGPQGRYSEFIAARIEQLVTTHPDLDGVMLDNFWEELSWTQVHRQLDSDCNPTINPEGCNGVPDANAGLDSLWNSALRGIAADIRGRFDVLQQGRPRPLVLITNNATDYFESLNGAMTEYFPSGHSNVDYDNFYGYNWNEEMLGAPGGYLVTPFDTDPVRVRMLNATYFGTMWQPARNPEFERNKRLTLVSSLFGDGFYSLDAAATGHANLWWEPEYDHAGRGKGYLGQPLGPMVRLLQPTGPEMFVNGDFADGDNGWFGFPFAGASGSHTLDTADYHSAPAALRVDVTAATGIGHYKIWPSSSVTLVHHQPYTLSFWARATTTRIVSMHFYSEDCPSSRCWNDHRFFVTPEWQRFETSFYSRGTAATSLNLFVSDAGSMWFDDLSLRPGDTSLFRRDFEHGVTLLNYTNSNQTVDLGGTYWRLRIPGSDVFDGAPVTQETIAPSDGRIVLTDSVPPLPDTTTVSDAPVAPRRNLLAQNQPNPFNPSTEIAFTLARDGIVRLEIYDTAGRRRRVLLDAPRTGGFLHRVRWDGADERGRAMPSGVYLYRITTPGWTTARKLVLVR